MYWFGEPWPSEDLRAAVCEDDKDRVPAPSPEELCGLCEKPMGENPQGVVVPHQGWDERAQFVTWIENRYIHIDCLIRSVSATESRSQ